jgi:DNA-binding transcriptional LysR family regulator
MLNLYQLQRFLAVVDSGSFSAAAERLHVTQPAVSEGVRALEQRLGVRLFDRRGHRATVTPEGNVLIASARHLLAVAEEAEQDILRQRGIISGALRLATATSAGVLALAGRLGAFAGTHPAVRLSLAPRDATAVLDGLRLGEIDAGFLAERTRGDRLVYLTVAADEWVLLVPPGHAWLAAPPEGDEAPAAPAPRKRGRPPRQPPGPAPWPVSRARPAADLRGQPLVLESTQSILGGQARRELRDLLEERGLPWGEVRLGLELPRVAEVIRAVEAGGGIGLVPLAHLAGYAGPACPVRVEGPPLVRHLYAVRDGRIDPAPATAAWWDFLAAGSAAPGA